MLPALIHFFRPHSVACFFYQFRPLGKIQFFKPIAAFKDFFSRLSVFVKQKHAWIKEEDAKWISNLKSSAKYGGKLQSEDATLLNYWELPRIIFTGSNTECGNQGSLLYGGLPKWPE
jgi:hypothetical protein